MLVYYETTNFWSPPNKLEPDRGTGIKLDACMCQAVAWVLKLLEHGRGVSFAVPETGSARLQVVCS